MATPPASQIQNAQIRYQNQLADRRTEAHVDRETEEAKNERNVENSEAEAMSSINAEEEARVRALEQMYAAQNVAQKLRTTKKASLKGLAKRVSVWFGLGVAIFLFCVQFIFAFVSIVLIAGESALSQIAVVGSVTNWLLDLAGLDIGAAGYVLWGIATLINLSTFVGFYFMFKIRGVEPFKTMLGMFIGLLALALSFLPLFNLFPWLILWVIYVNISIFIQ